MYKEAEGTRQYSSMLKKMFQRKGKKIFFCMHTAVKARMCGLNCKKGIHTGHRKSTNEKP